MKNILLATLLIFLLNSFQNLHAAEIKALRSPCTSLWTITHSIDFAKGFNGLLGHQQAIGHAFHITSDEILNWNQIY